MRNIALIHQFIQSWNIFIYDLIESDAGIDQTLCSEVTYLTASDPGNGTGYWSVVAGSGSANFETISEPNTKVENLDQGTNIIRWTIVHKECISTDEVYITNNNPDPVDIESTYCVSIFIGT